jgi:hypothetical protein
MIRSNAGTLDAAVIAAAISVITLLFTLGVIT